MADRVVERGPALELDDAKFELAVTVAVIDEERAAWEPTVVELPGGQRRSTPAHEAFTREHLERIRAAGGTRAEALEYAALFLSDRDVARLATDLDSYGEWVGDVKAAG